MLLRVYMLEEILAFFKKIRKFRLGFTKMVYEKILGSINKQLIQL